MAAVGVGRGTFQASFSGGWRGFGSCSSHQPGSKPEPTVPTISKTVEVRTERNNTCALQLAIDKLATWRAIPQGSYQFDLDIPHTLVSLTLANGKNMQYVQVEMVSDSKGGIALRRLRRVMLACQHTDRCLKAGIGMDRVKLNIQRHECLCNFRSNADEQYRSS